MATPPRGLSIEASAEILPVDGEAHLSEGVAPAQAVPVGLVEILVVGRCSLGEHGVGWGLVVLLF